MTRPSTPAGARVLSQCGPVIDPLLCRIRLDEPLASTFAPECHEPEQRGREQRNRRWLRSGANVRNCDVCYVEVTAAAFTGNLQGGEALCRDVCEILDVYAVKEPPELSYGSVRGCWHDATDQHQDASRRAGGSM